MGVCLDRDQILQKGFPFSQEKNRDYGYCLGSVSRVHHNVRRFLNEFVVSSYNSSR